MMKKNKAHDAAQYTFAAGEPILVDANVWIYLQPPISQPTPAHVAVYGTVLKNALAAKAQPLIDAVVLSEYIYRCCRIELGAWRKKNPSAPKKYSDLRKFRRTPHFTPIAQAVTGDANAILRLCAIKDTTVDRIDLDEIFSAFIAGDLDFNDGVIVRACRRNGWKLLTHDEDIALGEIEVLTANPSLLAACP